MEKELFERAPVHRAYFRFALPVVLSMVLALVYNMADTFFIAKTGDTNLIAGVSLCAPIFTLMLALGDLFGLGGSSLLSRLFGEKAEERARRVSVFCVYGTILVGFLSAALLLIFETPVLAFLGADEETMPYAREYYRYIAIGAPAIIFSLTPSNTLRTEGLTNESMVGNMMGSILNIIMDPIFIFALDMGAAGAAIATVLGNLGADAYYFWVFSRKSKALSADPRLFAFDADTLKQILLIGIPASVTNLMQSLGIAMVNRRLLPFGNDKIAMMGIVLKISMIAILVLVGFAFGAQPLIGYNYGAKNRKRLFGILRFAYFFECLTALVLSGGLMLFAPQLISLFLGGEAMIAGGAQMLRLQMTSAVFAGIVLVSTVTFQAAGKALGALLLSVSRQGVLLALALAVMTPVFGYTGVILAQPMADLATVLMAAGLFFAMLYRPMLRDASAAEQ